MRGRVLAGIKWPLTQARVPGRPKGGVFLVVGSPGAFHVPLYGRPCILPELTRVSTITSLPIDRPDKPAASLKVGYRSHLKARSRSEILPLHCSELILARLEIMAVLDRPWTRVG